MKNQGHLCHRHNALEMRVRSRALRRGRGSNGGVEVGTPGCLPRFALSGPGHPHLHVRGLDHVWLCFLPALTAKNQTWSPASAHTSLLQFKVSGRDLPAGHPWPQTPTHSPPRAAVSPGAACTSFAREQLPNSTPPRSSAPKPREGKGNSDIFPVISPPGPLPLGRAL